MREKEVKNNNVTLYKELPVCLNHVGMSFAYTGSG